MDKQQKRGNIIVEGAREHNLKDISVVIPRQSLTVVTGLSGSGKSSLAFDTIYAEGNRRYLETFSPYARGFLGKLERPDVDKIVGLSPVISIEQKTTVNNPRSTVGTTTEVYDFLRLLFARTSTAFSLSTGKALVSYTEEQTLQEILSGFSGEKVFLMAPIVKDRKGHYRELLENMRKRGFVQVRVDGKMMDLVPGMALTRYKNHTVEVLVDKLKITADQEERLKESLKTAMELGKKVALVLNPETGKERHFSRELMDEDTGMSYHEPAPHTFSFNSPQGACPKCRGIGAITAVDIKKIVPNMKLSIKEGALAPLGKYRDVMVFKQLIAITANYGESITTPLKTIRPNSAMTL